MRKALTAGNLDGPQEELRRYVAGSFEVDSEELEGVHFLVADEDDCSIEGEAFYLFLKGGKLFEVNASHCSCYGFENQWKPEETSAAALLMRPQFSQPGEMRELLLGLQERLTAKF